MSDTVRPKAKYKATNWASKNAALKARGALTIWLDRDMQWLATANGKRGRQRIFSDAAGTPRSGRSGTWATWRATKRYGLACGGYGQNL